MFRKKNVLKIDATITHDGKNWIAFNNSFTAAGSSLEELDVAIKNTLKEKGLLPSKKTVHVFMTCDNEIIPGWMRPFHNHYFNRILEIDK